MGLDDLLSYREVQRAKRIVGVRVYVWVSLCEGKGRKEKSDKNVGWFYFLFIICWECWKDSTEWSKKDSEGD